MPRCELKKTVTTDKAINPALILSTGKLKIDHASIATAIGSSIET